MIVSDGRESPAARRALRLFQMLALAVLPLGAVACGSDDTLTEPEVSFLESASVDASEQLDVLVANGVISPQLAERLRRALADYAADLRKAVENGRISAREARKLYQERAADLLRRAIAAHTGV